jgi:hypothetical protein
MSTSQISSEGAVAHAERVGAKNKDSPVHYLSY